MDYRLLLKRYMARVRDMEGRTYLSHWQDRGNRPPLALRESARPLTPVTFPLNAQEIDALLAIESELPPTYLDEAVAADSHQ